MRAGSVIIDDDHTKPRYNHPMQDVALNITGFDEMVDKMRRVGIAGADRSIKRASRKALKPTIAGMRGVVPQKTGEWKRNIAIHIGRSRKGEVRVRLGVRTLKKQYAKTGENVREKRVGKSYSVAAAAYYFRFVELGTKHISPRLKMTDFFESDADNIVRRLREHTAIELDREILKMR